MPQLTATIGVRRRLPTFVVIGAAKSGTTSLHEYLKQHPDVFMSPVKEPNYFSFAGRPPRFRGPDDDGLACEASADRLRVAKYAASVWREEDYARLFARARRQTAVGESSVSYMYFPEAAERLRASLPDVRLVALLRHPADRAYSKFMQFAGEGCEPLEDFDAALAAEDERVRRGWSPTWFYRRRGLYHAQLERFYDRFGPDRIRVFLYEDFASNPQRVLSEIFRFIGVDDRFVPDTARRHNRSSLRRLPRSHLVERLTSFRATATLVRLLPERGLDLLQRSLQRVNSRHEPWLPPTWSADTRARLTESFRPDIQALGRLIGRDLSSWLQP